MATRLRGRPRAARRSAVSGGDDQVMAVLSQARLPALALLLVALACLGGCGGHRGVRVAEPYRLSGAACLRSLDANGISRAPWAVNPPRSCAIATPLITPRSRTVRFDPPLRTSCGLLAAWADFEPRLQAAARRYLGSPVAVVRHYGSYACRNVAGSSRPSQHARARAIDLAGFVTADGRTVSVRDDYDGWGAKGRFLRAAAAAACRNFSAVLTPNTDRAHGDHLHLDLGPWRLCDA